MSTPKTQAFPGFDSPGVGFEQPFELLEACHERVQRSLTLLVKLMDYIDSQGHDDTSRTAAVNVLRYFDQAAPLHHDDEEEHVFPLLLAQADTQLHSTVHRLQKDHLEMSALWGALRVPLLRWSQADSSGAVDAATRTEAEKFCALYGPHIEAEEYLVYPASRTRMDANTLAGMGREMQRRRQA